MQHLLLLHGAIGAKDQFNPLIEKLNGLFELHTLNFSGHGGNEIPDDFSIERFANDVLTYLSEKQIKTIDLFGYSMGGYVAIYLAKHHPEKVRKIATLATKFEWTPEIAQREIKMLDARKIEDKVPAFAKQLQERHAPSDWKSILEKTALMMIKLGDKNPLHRDDYASISQKTLICIGDKDAMVSLEETIAVYKSLPNAALVVWPDTQHPIEKVNLHRISSEIRDFFLKVFN